jgi:hypothetical protein
MLGPQSGITAGEDETEPVVTHHSRKQVTVEAGD